MNLLPSWLSLRSAFPLPSSLLLPLIAASDRLSLGLQPAALHFLFDLLAVRLAVGEVKPPDLLPISMRVLKVSA